MIPVPIVDVGFPVGVQALPFWHIGDSVRGIIGTAALADVDLVFTEIPLSKVVSFTVERGVQAVNDPIITYDAGTATIVLDDPDGDFDPDNLAGPYVSGGETQVTPMVPVRIRARYGTTVYPVFYGFADRWNLDCVSPTESRVTVRATDAFKIFQALSARELGAPVGDNDNGGQRVGRILDAADWPADDRLISPGNTSMLETTFPGTALEEMQLATTSELGQLYVDPQGRVVFRNRRWYITDTVATTSQGTFGSDLSGGELPYKDRELDYGDSRIANQVLATSGGGTQQSKSDVASQTRYGVRRFARDDLVLHSDKQTLDWAGLILYQSKDLEQWFTSLSVDPRASEDDLYPQILGRDLGHRITVRRRLSNALAPLNGNPYFENDVSGWFGNSGEGSIVRSTAQAHQGVASLLLTPDGVGTQAAARSDAVAGISPGQSLRAQGWVRCAVARTVRIRVDWRDSGGTFLSATSADVAVSADTWTFLDISGTAPASTARAGITVLMTGTPAGSHLLYVDEAQLRNAPISRDCFIRGVSHSYGPGPNRWSTKWALQSASKYVFFTVADTDRGRLGVYGLS